eukprot:8569729-Alexandrium_andersonii.AAC.1
MPPIAAESCRQEPKAAELCITHPSERLARLKPSCAVSDACCAPAEFCPRRPPRKGASAPDS